MISMLLEVLEIKLQYICCDDVMGNC